MAGCPTRSPSFCAMTRVTMSAGPPGGKGTIQRIGFEGHAVCDWTPGAMAHSAANNKTAAWAFIRLLLERAVPGCSGREVVEAGIFDDSIRPRHAATTRDEAGR